VNCTSKGHCTSTQHLHRSKTPLRRGREALTAELGSRIHPNLSKNVKTPNGTEEAANPDVDGVARPDRVWYYCLIYDSWSVREVGPKGRQGAK